jgi:hypothetical protein
MCRFKGNDMTINKTIKQKKSAILEGIIIPTAWNSRGHPTKFSLFTFDEREYKIDPGNTKNIDFSAFIQKKIRISYHQDINKESAEDIMPEEIYTMNGQNE